ncbi:small integral membrane protein 43-like [Tachysurus fulvidraco]|uniref:small integral membrane protein 43-like n=1 Tax=Tachysurus fulvidraco TaxID=1234273 RepID=UPI001FEEF5D6|nr:small integral membrane protein 43-like [Tachysurus fulvidraco]
MPAPRRFLVASTSMPLEMGWGWNICVYLGLLTLLLLLMGLLLWMVLKQLRNSVGNTAMQSGRSFREPHFGNGRRFRF